MRLSQAIALGVDARRTHDQHVQVLKTLMTNQDAMNGSHRRYEPINDDEPTLPPESKLAQLTWLEGMRTAHDVMANLFSVQAIRDFGNCISDADIMIGDTVLMRKVPPTYLLFLETVLKDLHSVVSGIVERDPVRDWTFDDSSGKYRAPETRQVRQERRKVALQLTPTTTEHPGTAQIVEEAKAVGYWIETKESGAIGRTEKRALLLKIETLQRAVKMAREEANANAVDDIDVKPLLDFLFSDLDPR